MVKLENDQDQKLKVRSRADLEQSWKWTCCPSFKVRWHLTHKYWNFIKTINNAAPSLVSSVWCMLKKLSDSVTQSILQLTLSALCFLTTRWQNLTRSTFNLSNNTHIRCPFFVTSPLERGASTQSTHEKSLSLSSTFPSPSSQHQTFNHSDRTGSNQMDDGAESH